MKFIDGMFEVFEYVAIMIFIVIVSVGILGGGVYLLSQLVDK